MDFTCAAHPERGSCGDYLIDYSPAFDEYGIWVHDGLNGVSDSSLTIDYCPFCGIGLPPSRREQWFDVLESRDLEPEEAPAR